MKPNNAQANKGWHLLQHRYQDKFKSPSEHLLCGRPLRFVSILHCDNRDMGEGSVRAREEEKRKENYMYNK